MGSFLEKNIIYNRSIVAEDLTIQNDLLTFNPEGISSTI